MKIIIEDGKVDFIKVLVDLRLILENSNVVQDIFSLLEEYCENKNMG